MEAYQEELLGSVRRLRQVMKQISFEIYKDAELTLPQLGVVAVLTEGGPQKVSLIAEQIGLANSTVSGIIDRLCKKGVVQRQRLEEDRRTVLISLSEGSEHYYQEYKKRRNAFILEKLKDLDREETVEMTVALNRLSDLLS